MILKPRPFRKPKKGHWATKNLVGCWLMNEGSGDKVYDLSGNNKTGTFFGDTHFVPGKFGPCINLDGDGDYVGIADLSSPLETTNFSVCLWLQNDLTDADGKSRPILSNFAGTDSFEITWMGAGAYDEQFCARLYNSTPTLHSVYSLQNDIDTDWHFIAVTLDGSYLTLYKDGILQNATAFSGSVRNGENTYRIGSDGSANYWTGSIDVLSIYNRTLSPSEIVELYREPFCMLDYEPIELWAAATIGGAPPVGNVGIMTPNTGYWGPTF
jgi:hypothetical protein